MFATYSVGVRVMEYSREQCLEQVAYYTEQVAYYTKRAAYWTRRAKHPEAFNALEH